MARTSQNRLHPSGRGPHTSLAEDKLNAEAFAGAQPHQSKQALESRAVISAGKALAGSQNKSSSGGFPGSQLTKIYYQRMQSAELCVRRSGGRQSWASAAPHIWRGCNHRPRTVLEIRYSGYQEVDSTSTSLAKHALIFQVFFYKAVFCLEDRVKLCAGKMRRDGAGAFGDFGPFLKKHRLIESCWFVSAL